MIVAAELQPVPKPAMIPVRSSNIDAVGYDPVSSELYVRFTSGTTYIYLGVGQALYEGLLSAPSAGRFLNRNVKRSHSFRRL